MRKKAEISAFRLFILENQEVFRNYRRENRYGDFRDASDVYAAESNMNLFSRRLNKMGYSWSFEGLEGMVSAMIHRSLVKAIQQASGSRTRKNKPTEYPSFASLLTEKASQAIVVIKGHIPALVRDDQGKPYTKALRGFPGF